MGREREKAYSNIARVAMRRGTVLQIAALGYAAGIISAGGFVEGAYVVGVVWVAIVDAGDQIVSGSSEIIARVLRALDRQAKRVR